MTAYPYFPNRLHGINQRSFEGLIQQDGSQLAESPPGIDNNEKRGFPSTRFSFPRFRGESSQAAMP